jgi:Homeodomain-like domain
VPYVLTVDQVASRGRADRVGSALAALSHVPTTLPFVRTVGDEFQGLLADPLSVVDAILTLMHPQHEVGWHIGLGIGPVETPLPPAAPAARGPAFLAAREAVERAKSTRAGVCIAAPADAEREAADAEVVLHLLQALRERRTAQGWEAIDLAARGWSQAHIAEHLGVSRQAVSQRLVAAAWSHEVHARPVLARLLTRVDVEASP